MGRRIFIAINLPEDIKKKLAGYKDIWPELPAKWTEKNNLHITLVFLGYVRDEEIMDIIKSVKDISKNYSSFNVNLKEICYGPIKKTPPRMIWAVGEKSKELAKLRDDLEKTFFPVAISKKMEKFMPIEKEQQAFSPHITLARIRQIGWRRFEPEERPTISEKIDLSFLVESIEIMESELKKGGPKYTILESINFKD